MIETWRRGDEPKIGPQIDRNRAEGPQGRTSLFSPIEHQTHSRDFAAAKAEWEEAKEAAKKAAEAKK